jgi:hypothetical protein
LFCYNKFFHVDLESFEFLLLDRRRSSNIAIATKVQKIIDSGLGGRAKNTDTRPLAGFLNTSFHFQSLTGYLQEFSC